MIELTYILSILWSFWNLLDIQFPTTFYVFMREMCILSSLNIWSHIWLLDLNLSVVKAHILTHFSLLYLSITQVNVLNYCTKYVYQPIYLSVYLSITHGFILLPLIQIQYYGVNFHLHLLSFLIYVFLQQREKPCSYYLHYIYLFYLLPSMGSHRVGHNWSDLAYNAVSELLTHTTWKTNLLSYSIMYIYLLSKVLHSKVSYITSFLPHLFQYGNIHL